MQKRKKLAERLREDKRSPNEILEWLGSELERLAENNPCCKEQYAKLLEELCLFKAAELKELKTLAEAEASLHRISNSLGHANETLDHTLTQLAENRQELNERWKEIETAKQVIKEQDKKPKITH